MVYYLWRRGITIELANGIKPMIIYSFVTANDILVSILFGVFIATIAGLYPAYLALKSKPVDALRFI